MNEENYTAFESYLNNEMPANERTSFEKQLQTDINFKQNFEVYKETTSFLENKFDTETLDFNQNLKSILEQSFSDSKKDSTRVIAFKPWQYAIAACVTLFIGSLLYMQNSTPNYSDFNQHEDAHFIERGEASQNLKAAQDAFNAKKYEIANPLFENALKDFPQPEIQYFYGVSLLESNKINEAEAVFQKLKLGKSVYKNKAIWNLALIQLKQKNYKLFKQILLTIPKDYEDYEKVEKLLKKL